MRVLAVTTHRPAEVVDSVSEMDGESEVISIDNTAGLLSRNVSAFRETRRELDRFRPDVLFLDCYGLMGLVVTLLARLYGVPVVARIVGDSWRIYGEEGMRKSLRERDYGRAIRYQMNLLLSNLIYSQVSGFAVVSADLEDVVHRHTDCPRSRIGVIPVPITKDMLGEGSAAAAREDLCIDEERVVLTVTNLAFHGKYEGVKTVIEELLPVLESNSDVASIVAGGNTYHADLQTHLEQSIDDRSVRSRIYAPGFVEDVENLYALADVFVYVSYLDGYPNAVLEAQTAELPVVANDAFGMSEQITHGESGLLVDDADEGELRDHVEDLLDDPDRRQCLGRGGRKRSLHENTPDVVGDQLQTFLETILDTGART